MNRFILTTLLCLICYVSFSTQTVNKNIKRKIDISSQLVKIDIDVTAEITEDIYSLVIEKNLNEKVAFISALIKEDGKQRKLDVKTGSDKSFKINVGQANVGKTVSLSISMVFTHVLQPFPKEIKQAETQFMKYEGNLYFYSPYESKSQDTKVVCASKNIISYTDSIKPVSKQDQTISYGPFKDTPKLKEAELTVHYENNSPFLTITSMTRWIEVSHWGNIAIEETVDISHCGADLKGSFSRYDYQRTQAADSSVKAITTVLPASAKDVYYRDEIGNISTSHMKELPDSVELELRPRFPLFGGWKTRYTVGYNVPIYEYLYKLGNTFGLQMRFVDHVFDDQVIDDLTVKVVLPEKVHNVKTKFPYTVKESKREVLKTYLDTEGRTVIVLHKKNLVEQHIKNFEIFYEFNPVSMCREPIMAMVFFFCLFSVVIVYVRLDFSISKDEASESRMRVSGLIDQLQALHDSRTAVYQQYEDGIYRFKQSKDSDRFLNDRKQTEADHKLLNDSIAQLAEKLRSDSAEAAEKVKELQSNDSALKEQISQSIQFAETLVRGKLTKNQYLEQEARVTTKKNEIKNRMDMIVSGL